MNFFMAAPDFCKACRHFIRINICARRFDVIAYVSNEHIVSQCEEKRRLFTAYQDATAAYSQLVRQLADAAGSVVFTEFQFVNRRVRAARKSSLEARDLLNKHTAEHKC
jgi:hypothetical protein